MGLGLYLQWVGGVPSPAVLGNAVERRAAGLLEHATDTGETLLVGLHPAAEDVEFVWDDQTLTVSAKTSSAGLGYHVAVCDLLAGVADDLGGAWVPLDEEGGDETGYWTTRHRGALEAELLAWLQSLCARVLELAAGGSTGFAISLPTAVEFEWDTLLLTPLGPRDRAWATAVAEDPRVGIDIFPWWEVGRGASFLLGRALCRMWTDVRWRAPLDEAERAALARVDADLRAAIALDPRLRYPWPEWAALQEWLGHDDAVARHVRARGAAQAATLGYRRHPVREALTGGWWIRIPGDMSTSFDNDGTWCAVAPGRTLWMSSFSHDASTVASLPTARPAPGSTPFDLGLIGSGYVARASMSPAEEGAVQLAVEVVRPHHLALLTFVLDDPDDLPWARGVVQSLWSR